MVKISKNSSNFVIFVFFSKTLLNFYVTWTLNIHQKHFWIFWAIFGNNLRGKTQLSFFTPFFSSACIFGRKCNRPKFWVGQISKYACFSPKTFWGRISNIDDNLRGSWGGKKHYVFSPPTNPNRDFVPFYARREAIIEFKKD